MHGAKKLLRATVGIVALAGPLAIALGHVPAIRAQSQQDSGAGSNERPLVFDAASIKPNTFRGGGRGAEGGLIPPGANSGDLRFTPGRVAAGPAGVTVRKIILEAFHLTEYQLSGGPGWLDSDRFDLQAKAEGANENQLRQMLQALLAAPCSIRPASREFTSFTWCGTRAKTFCRHYNSSSG